MRAYAGCFQCRNIHAACQKRHANLAGGLQASHCLEACTVLRHAITSLCVQRVGSRPYCMYYGLNSCHPVVPVGPVAQLKLSRTSLSQASSSGVCCVHMSGTMLILWRLLIMWVSAAGPSNSALTSRSCQSLQLSQQWPSSMAVNQPLRNS